VKTYIVYRFDYLRQEKEQIGELLERRSKDRGNNIEALLRLAQTKYPTPMDSHLVIYPK
jgi:hypothetical protein